MATNIPPHNLRETIDATIAYMDDPAIEVEALMQHIKGPDFPTAGVILGMSGIRDAYRSGRGRCACRRARTPSSCAAAREAIVVTELPYQVKKGGPTGVIARIAELAKDKVIPEVVDIEDHSSDEGMRIVIHLKRDALPKVVLNKLFKHTPMQTTFGVNMVALVDGVPKTLGAARDPRRLRRPPARGRSSAALKHELRQKEARLHVLDGLLIALTTSTRSSS